MSEVTFEVTFEGMFGMLLRAAMLGEGEKSERYKSHGEVLDVGGMVAYRRRTDTRCHPSIQVRSGRRRRRELD